MFMTATLVHERQEECYKFKASNMKSRLQVSEGNKVRPCFKNKESKFQKKNITDMNQ